MFPITLSFSIKNQNQMNQLNDLMLAINNGPAETMNDIANKVDCAKLPTIFDSVEQHTQPERTLPSTTIIPFTPPTPQSAPVTTTEDERTPAPEGALDSRGLPWDQRIHSVGRNFNKDGTWRNRKGVDRNLLNQVEQELIIKAKGQQAAAFTPPPIAPVIPNISAPSMTPTAPAMPPMPQAAGSILQGHTLETFKSNLVPIVAELINTKKLTQDYVAQLNQHFGVTQLWMVMNDENKVTELFNNFVKYELVTVRTVQ